VRRESIEREESNEFIPKEQITQEFIVELLRKHDIEITER
jgi:hypothetical protein